MTSDLETDSEAAHELFQSYDAMEGLHPIAATPGPPATWRDFVWRVYPGLLTAATIALAATWLAQHYGSPVMLFALLFGMTFHFLHEEGRCVAGIEFSSKTVLRLGVALLGARITLRPDHRARRRAHRHRDRRPARQPSHSELVLSRRLGQSRAFGVLSGGAVGDLRRVRRARHRLGPAARARKRTRHDPHRRDRHAPVDFRDGPLSAPRHGPRVRPM